MTGPHDGVIGMDRQAVIARFRTGLPTRFEPASGDSAPPRRARQRPIRRPGGAPHRAIAVTSAMLDEWEG